MTITIIFLIAGLMTGSFLNVVIKRLPLDQSIVLPASHCPHCKHKIRFYDNIPVISYLILMGKCRDCKTRIPIQYPVVEILNAAGYLAILHYFGFSLATIIYCLLYSSLVAITFIDLEHMIIPDIITLPGIIIGIMSSYAILPTGFEESIMGLLLGGGIFYLAALLSRGGMGGGDIKLIAMIGAFTGWQKVLMVIILSAGLGSLVGILLMIIKKKDRKYAIPYGPFLAVATFVALLKGTELLIWYTGLFRKF